MNERRLKIFREMGKLVGKSLAVAVFSIVIVLFFAQKIDSKEKKIVKERNDFAVFSKRQEITNQLKIDNEQIKEKTEKLESLLPTWDNATVIIDYLNALAANTQNIAAVRIDSAPAFNPESQVGSVGLSIELNGTTSTLLEFLRKMERSPYVININSLSTTFANGQGGQLTAKMSGIIFLRKD